VASDGADISAKALCRGVRCHPAGCRSRQLGMVVLVTGKFFPVSLPGQRDGRESIATRPMRHPPTEAGARAVQTGLAQVRPEWGPLAPSFRRSRPLSIPAQGLDIRSNGGGTRPCEIIRHAASHRARLGLRIRSCLGSICRCAVRMRPGPRAPFPDRPRPRCRPCRH
jgi:hypothetical protein